MFNLPRALCLLLALAPLLTRSDNPNGTYISSNRQERLFILPFFLPIRRRVTPTPCTGVNNLQGTCLTRNQCIAQAGVISGACTQPNSVCCVFTYTCGGTTSMTSAYFNNPGYPASFNGGNRCTMVINRANPGICQLRLNFIDFSLSQPNNDGNCVNDFFSVSVPNNPILCGDNSGQHEYIDFDPTCDAITITVDTSSAAGTGRRWNIQTTQIPCNSSDLAPRGCQQFYRDTSGTVSSFNFGMGVPTTITNGWTRQLANLNYGVCIEPVVGYCSIEWSQADGSPYTFTVSDDTSILEPNVGVPGAELNGADCTHNFVVIPNPMQDNVLPADLATDRFCGNYFQTVTSSSKPFVMTVVTNFQETDVGNRGFQLNYRLIPCRP